MGIETSVDLGGSESSFTSAIIAIEELAKVDPSVSVMCDVHNTLVNTVIRKYGTKEQQEKYLSRLAQTTVCLSADLRTQFYVYSRSALAGKFLFVRTGLRLRCIRASDPREEGRQQLDTERL